MNACTVCDMLNHLRQGTISYWLQQRSDVLMKSGKFGLTGKETFDG